MPMWRCPHCGTPQAETARCWVCRRSSTSCGTCRHYRRSVAGHIGYCGLDRRRQPLTGEEIRGCWEASPAALLTTQGAPPTIAPAPPPDDGRQVLAFVEVTALTITEDEDATDGAPAISATAAVVSAREPGWSLWGDLEA